MVLLAWADEIYIFMMSSALAKKGRLDDIWQRKEISWGKHGKTMESMVSDALRLSGGLQALRLARVLRVARHARRRRLFSKRVHLWLPQTTRLPEILTSLSLEALSVLSAAGELGNLDESRRLV